jgi:hypothetical protein
MHYSSKIESTLNNEFDTIGNIVDGDYYDPNFIKYIEPFIKKNKIVDIASGYKIKLPCCMKKKVSNSNDVYEYKDLWVSDEICESYDLKNNDYKCDKFMNVYCKYMLNEYLKSMDPYLDFNITKHDKKYEKIFDPIDWNILYPECACYGHDNYKYYKKIKESANIPIKCYKTGCSKGNAYFDNTIKKSRDCGSICINNTLIDDLRAGGNIKVNVNTSQSCNSVINNNEIDDVNKNDIKKNDIENNVNNDVKNNIVNNNITKNDDISNYYLSSYIKKISDIAIYVLIIILIIIIIIIFYI